MTDTKNTTTQIPVEDAAVEAALYLIPVTIGNTPHEQVLPSANAGIVRHIRHFIVEEIRTARRFLRRMDPSFPIDDSTFHEMGKHADTALFSQYLAPIEKGIPVGVISEAGCPAVADPGADIVALAQRRGIKVRPLVGPNSMILAVMASGLGGQSFAFNGYLPVQDADRLKRIRQLESRAWNEGQTQLFIETPYRNAKMFNALCSALRPDTRMCIAAGITTPEEWICTHTVREWKNIPLPDLSKTPAIFLVGR